MMRKMQVFGASFFLWTALAGCSASSAKHGETGGATGGSGGTDGTAATGSGGQPGFVATANKVDLLFMIDNSRTMSDKQAVLDLAIPGLVKRLVNPPCVDSLGTVITRPKGPLEACPEHSVRELNPVLDMHIGIVDSSLGGHGSDACSNAGIGKISNDDKGHLIDRKDPTKEETLPTYAGRHFLAWDPSQKMKPPGEGDVDALLASFNNLVTGVGEVGCGYESQLESWYRFLVDPMPYESLTLDKDADVVLEGVDKTLLEQRKAFLRPSSALAIIMLTDEDDCSVRDSGQFYYVLQQKTPNGSPFHMPRARAICDTDPNDACCFSCGQTGPKDSAGNPKCAPDPVCKDFSGKTDYLSDLEDNINLRCWNQKRRYGIDFLNPAERYVRGLTEPVIADRNGQIVPNPIFSDLDPSDADSNVRSKDLVFLTGIVGVPWQDIARLNASGKPDLKSGVNADGKPVGGFKSAEEMAMPIAGLGHSTWDLVLGDPSKYPAAQSLPLDPFMLETFEARSGVNPLTGDKVLPPGTPNEEGNSINGHEWSILKQDDLQYACVFDLPEKYRRDCSTSGLYAGCDCESSNNDSPLCELNPGSGKPTTQVRAKAYPGIRHLQVLEGLGPQGVVGSICAKQLDAPDAPDFGYAPAMTALIERMKPHLQ